MNTKTPNVVLLLPSGKTVEARHAIALLYAINHRRAMGSLKTLNELILAGLLGEGRGLTVDGRYFVNTNAAYLNQIHNKQYDLLGVIRG